MTPDAPAPPSPLERRKPDYAGGGIVNLMASIIQARGGRSDYPQLTLMPALEPARATNILLLVIDGLGADWLAEHSPQGILHRHQVGTMTTVFPSTTATAITSFLTGDGPLQHGLTGWYTWFAELACVMTVLPGVPRYGGVPYRKAGIDPRRLFGHRSVFDRIRTRALVVSPNRIARSDFNLAHTGAAQVLPYADLHDLFRQSARALRRDRVPKYLYCYWPDLDSIGHHQGMGSAAAVAHLQQIEQALADFLVAAAGTDTLVLVTADHGQLDTGPADLIDLADHPDLADCLALPLCGEPRAAFCYLRLGRERPFLDYCRGPLGDLVEVCPSRDLMDAGYFGLGPAHPRFTERIGDYCLLPRGRRILRQLLPFEQPKPLIGQHGGLSRTELLVPLCALRA
ncbi:alkaline phosphatase family protein [uncultured Thiodictyon sp.]|uniref:alkaline phosphatase family protein n=1 Tax=uncultured Thiodictyon sp. TaxID=1846217 RepID=UPI0025D060B6|nr:alkaline phosphatase family protein [uncultured Thiodictyon sp.]